MAYIVYEGDMRRALAHFGMHELEKRECASYFRNIALHLTSAAWSHLGPGGDCTDMGRCIDLGAD